MKWVWRTLKFFVVVLLLGAAGLWLAGKRAGANHLHSEIEIAKPPAEVWEWVSQPEHMKQWVSWLVDVRMDDVSQRGVGLKYVMVMRDENNGGQLMEIRNTCTDFSPPNYLRVTINVPEGIDGSQSYRITDLGGGRSRLESDMQYHFGNAFARLMEPLITPSAQKKMKRDVARLKQLVEEAR